MQNAVVQQPSTAAQQSRSSDSELALNRSAGMGAFAVGSGLAMAGIMLTRLWQKAVNLTRQATPSVAQLRPSLEVAPPPPHPSPAPYFKVHGPGPVCPLLFL